MHNKPLLPEEWTNELGKDKLIQLLEEPIRKASEARAKGKTIYPPEADTFKAFELCKPAKLKVVILGQDPYHGEHQAHGLCFSVPDGAAIPASLRNILKELADDLAHPGLTSGNLEAWAKQGVLMLNAVLSVEAKKAGSHSNFGWQKFTDYVIETISCNFDHIVFVLWETTLRKKLL